MSKSDSLAALRIRDFRLLWTGQLISQIGTQMQRAAILWHVYKLTGDVSLAAVALGLIALFRAAPVIIFSMIGGVVADAQDRRRVVLATQSTMALTAALLALSTFSGHVSVPIIYAAVFMTAAAAAFDGPARQSLVVNIVPRSVLPNAFSLNSIIGEVGRVVGPGVGGLLIGLAGDGIGIVYALNAASFAAVIAALLVMNPPPAPAEAEPSPRAVGTPRGKQFFVALAEGFRYLRSSPIIYSAMLMDFFASFFASANTLMPIFADQILKVGPTGYGLLLAAPSIGSIASGVFMSFRPQFERPGRIMLSAVGVFGLATTLFGLSVFVEPLARALGWPLAIGGMSIAMIYALLTFGLTGMGDTISTILRQTIRQMATPDHLRGRLTAINVMFAMGGPQLGDLEAGIVAGLWGAPFAVISGGVGSLIAVVLAARYARALVNYDGAHLREPLAPDALQTGPAGK
ncbi:MAG: MFS transporter [Chloroflexi bacterium]|nr:MFS transporter [Chloroflexota bacterium]